MINDGGPAFPLAGTHSGPESSGMSLRDYFAAAAMESIAYKYFEDKDIAFRAYKIADAMLKERMKSENN